MTNEARKLEFVNKIDLGENVMQSVWNCWVPILPYVEGSIVEFTHNSFHSESITNARAYLIEECTGGTW